MPHSGHIKRFVLEDFGLKFYYDIDEEKYTIPTLIEKKHMVLMFRFIFYTSFK